MSSGYPMNELASVRSLFFAKPGHSLGMKEMIVSTQAKKFDPAYPDDAQFVENVMWEDSRIGFVTLNISGSNNDTVPWSGSFADPGAQMQEVFERNGANMRWLKAAFSKAKNDHAKAIVIAVQADMWDPEALASN
jgi:hypothetical protein